jgi:ribonuclease-3
MPEPAADRSNFESPQQLAERLGLPFAGDYRLLSRALTHRSFVNENSNAPEDNERLEFLGDAVLDFIVGSWLYSHRPELKEGDLTKMRSALVRTETLAEFARQLNLGGAMRLGRGELSNGGRARDPLLCATFEAIVGAIYQAEGLDAVRAFVLPLLEPEADRVFTQLNSYDPKSELQEWTQSRKLGIPRYVDVRAAGPDHARIFEVEVWVGSIKLGGGQGTSKQSAHQAAAANALTHVHELEK